MTRSFAQSVAILAILAIPVGAGAAESQLDTEDSRPDEIERTGERQVSPSDERPLPPRKDANDGELWPWIKTVLALAVVVALVLLAHWLFRGAAGRAGPGRRLLGGQAGPMQVVAQTGLSGRHRLYLVRLGERLVLVGAGPQQLSTLTEVTDPPERDRLLEQLGVSGDGEKHDGRRRTDETDDDASEEDKR